MRNDSRSKSSGEVQSPGAQFENADVRTGPIRIWHQRGCPDFQVSRESITDGLASQPARRRALPSQVVVTLNRSNGDAPKGRLGEPKRRLAG